MGKPVEVEFIGKDKSLGSTMSSVESKASRLGGSLAKVGKVAAYGLVGGAIAAGAALAGMAKQAADDEKGVARLAQQMRNSAGATKTQTAAVEDWISKQGVALGVTDDDLRPALGKLVTATHDVGQAQKLASLAMDVSAGTGKSLESVSLALAKAHDGNVAGLSRLGIATKDASGKTLTFEQVTKSLATTFKGQAQTAANTTAGQYGRLKLILSETAESIGYKVLPLVTALATFLLNRVIPAVSAWGSQMSARLGPALSRIGDYLRNNIIPAIQQTAQWAKVNLVPALVSIGTFIVSKVLPAVAQFWTWLAVKILPVVRTALTHALNAARVAFAQVGAAIERNRPQLQQLLTAIGKVVTFILRNLYPVLAFLASTAFRVVGVAIVVLIGTIGALVSAFNTIKGAVNRVKSWITSIPGAIKGAFSGAASWLINAGEQIIDGLINGIESKISALKSKLSSITSLIPKIKGPPDKDKKLLYPAGQMIMDGLLKGIQHKWGPVKDFLAGVTANVKSVGDKLSTTLTARNDFAGGFQGFSSSIFGRDPGQDANGDPIAESVAGIKVFAAQQQAQAEQIQASVKKLIGLGLSTSLIKQLQGQGSSGIAQINALAASASRGDISYLNSTDKATSAALAGAGMAAGNAIYGSTIAQQQRDLAHAEAVADRLAKKLGPYLKDEVEFKIKGDDLVLLIKRNQQKRGKKQID